MTVKRMESSMPTKRIFISADHGLAMIYFLQTDVLPTLAGESIEVVLLTDDALIEKIRSASSARLDRRRAAA